MKGLLLIRSICRERTKRTKQRKCADSITASFSENDFWVLENQNLNNQLNHHNQRHAIITGRKHSKITKRVQHAQKRVSFPLATYIPCQGSPILR